MRAKLIAVVAIAVTIMAIALAGWQSKDGGSAVLAGVIVTDVSDPKPVRRASVRLVGAAGTSGRVVGTDDEGRFRFEALSAGTYTLLATKPGFVQTFHGSKHPGRGPAVPIAIADGQRLDVTVRLLPGAVITGLITDPQGNPAPGIPVAAVETRPAPGAVLAPVRATTDDLGMYRLFGLPPGDYLVSASPQIVPADGRGGGASSGAVPITTAADVQWARSGAGVGVAGGAGAPPPPSTRVVAYAPVFYPGTTSAAEAAVVRVTTGEERAGVGLSLRIVPMSRLSGTLTDASGQALTTATVSLYPRRGATPSAADMLVSSGALMLPRASVSATGFVFTGVAPGEYTLIARTGGGQRGALPPAGAAQPVILWSVTDVVVDGNDRSDLALRLLPGLTLAGRIDFERTTLVVPSDYPVEVSVIPLNPIPGVATPRADRKNDWFTFSSLPPGSYVVRANVMPASARQSWMLRSAVLNRRDLADRPVESSATGEEIRSLVVTLTDRVGEISGRLLDANNQPVTRYWIAVFTTDRSLWLPNARRIQSVQPGTDGSFTVTGLPAGEYAITAVGDSAPGDLADPTVLGELLASAFRFTLAEGERRRQDLRVK